MKDIPEEAINTHIKSISQSTIKQYNSCFKYWWDYCALKNVPYFLAKPPEVIAFFQYLMDNNKGWKFGTFNSCQAALALILPEATSNDIRLRRYFKGILKCRPKTFRYNVTWDPKVVLDYLAAFCPNEELDFLMLNKKLSTLLTLITGQRLQTLSLIKVDNIIINHHGVQIFIDDTIKTTHTRIEQPVLNIPFFGESPSLCVASLLLKYLERSAQYRSGDSNGQYLFISSRLPYQRASKQTLARWIKETMSNAGINTNIFTPHSTRHASTSKARRAGISVDVIRKTAGWSKSSQTLQKQYFLVNVILIDFKYIFMYPYCFFLNIQEYRKTVFRYGAYVGSCRLRTINKSNI